MGGPPADCCCVTQTSNTTKLRLTLAGRSPIDPREPQLHDLRPLAGRDSRGGIAVGVAAVHEEDLESDVGL